MCGEFLAGEPRPRRQRDAEPLALQYTGLYRADEGAVSPGRHSPRSERLGRVTTCAAEHPGWEVWPGGPGRSGLRSVTVIPRLRPPRACRELAPPDVALRFARQLELAARSDFAPFPVASTASSTASRGTQDASTPREIQSLKRPSATLPVCDLADAVDRVKAITGRIDLVHCNNSRDEFGSGRDRHANIAAGTIDPALLLAVVRAAGAPAICETPDEDGGLAADVSWLKQHLPA